MQFSRQTNRIGTDSSILLIQMIFSPSERKGRESFPHGAAAERVNCPYLCIILLTPIRNSALPLFRLRLHKHPSWQRSPTSALLIRIGRIRFHDLRHSAVSRMIAARVPIPMIAKIVGWSPSTMAKMAARYGHFGDEELRSAVESFSIPANLQIASGYSQLSPQSEREREININ